MNAVTVFLAFRQVDRNNLQPGFDQLFGGCMTIVDGQQHLAGPKSEAIDDPRIVCVMDFHHSNAPLFRTSRNQ